MTYDLRSTCAERVSDAGIANEWVTQLLRHGDARIFNKYSQLKLQIKREAFEDTNWRTSEMPPDSGTTTIL